MDSETCCFICLEEPLHQVQGPCGHAMCRACAEAWLAKKEECPMCRRALTLAQVLGSDDVDDAVVAEPNRSEAETIEGIGSVGSGTAMATSTRYIPPLCGEH
jgi:hypothetical protein